MGVVSHAAIRYFCRQMEVPKWADIVKTAAFKELAPYNEDWFYVRCASLARRIYIHGGLGVGALKSKYGGSKRNGVRTSPTSCSVCGSSAGCTLCLIFSNAVTHLSRHHPFAV